MKRKIIASVLASILACNILFVTVFAAGTDEHTDANHPYTTYSYSQSTMAGGTSGSQPYVAESTGSGSVEHVHRWVDDTANALPNCTTGTTKHYRCAICNHSWAAGTHSLDALGHKYDESSWVIDKEPTCTETGLKHQICRVCGEAGARNQNTSIPATGHNYKWVRTAKATCTEYEKRSFVCQNCGDVKYSNVIERYDENGNKTEGYWNEPLGHDYQFATKDLNNGIKEAATCTSDAIYYQVCSRCSARSESECNPIYGTQIEHNFVDGKCSDCGKVEWIYNVAKRLGLTRSVVPRN